tara:strand:- start:3072 stop:3557 length:486 start_codon:yes stop_codon:yes gene_type:complete
MKMEISDRDFLIFFDRALDGMSKIVGELGQEISNQRPNIEGVNSPYAVLYHCVSLTNYWIGTLIGSRETKRDRNNEFVAVGDIKSLLTSVETLKKQVRLDLQNYQGDQPPTEIPNIEYSPMKDYTDWNQAQVLLHTYEELAQHHGHIEITKDILIKSKPNS